MHRVRGGGTNQGQGKPAPAQLLHQPRSEIPGNRTKAGKYHEKAEVCVQSIDGMKDAYSHREITQWFWTGHF